jgi:hypothetical protein
MKDTQRIYAACTLGGVIVALIIWLALGLPWQALAIGIFTALCLYANMTEPMPNEKEKPRELSINELHPPR